MKVFVAASYSSKVDYETGEVFAEYKDWLEDILGTFEKLGHTVFCALREDGYKINDADPANAFRLDIEHIEQSDAILALLGSTASAGVQTEIGIAVALKKRVLLAHLPEDQMGYFNDAMLRAGAVQELELPFNTDSIQQALS